MVASAGAEVLTALVAPVPVAWDSIQVEVLVGARLGDEFVRPDIWPFEARACGVAGLSNDKSSHSKNNSRCEKAVLIHFRLLDDPYQSDVDIFFGEVCQAPKDCHAQQPRKRG